MNKFKMSSDLVRIVKSQVKSQYSGFHLLEYLSERFNYNSSEGWKSIIDDDRLRINGKPGTAQSLLSEGDTLEYFHLDHPEPEVDFNYKIIHKCDGYLVLDKPGNLPVHPAGKFFHNTLWSQLKKDGFEPRFVNRLDRETSGLILVALDKGTASKLGKQIQNKTVYKEYLAIVEGEFSGVHTARGYLEKDTQSKVDKKFLFKEDDDFEKYGKSGVDSSFELIDKKNGLSLIKCVIRTGKMHQIRASLKSLGFPIVGDKMYGLDESYYLKFIRKEFKEADLQVLRMQRQALHAHILKFIDPFTGLEVEFESDLPNDMQEVFG